MNLILVHGGNAETPRLAASAGWLYGVRDNSTAYAPVYMFDYDWQKPTTEKRWARYLQLVSEHQPYQAIAPDFECPEQWPVLKQQILDLKRAGAKRVIVTPKFDGALDFIPLWKAFIIGVSVPTSYAGFLPQPCAVAGRDLHFLGGHPDQWVYLRRLYEPGAIVFSIDGNNAIQQARDYGKYWSKARGGYAEMRGEMFDTEALTLASLRNTSAYMIDPPPTASLIGNERVQTCIHVLNRQMVMDL